MTTVQVTLDDPQLDVFESPPFLCIEILSRRDEISEVLEKLEEYEVFGVPNIWVLDPRRRKAFTYAGKRLEEVESDALVTADGQARLSLEDVFRGL
ncbi:MAG: hypothetical protein C5B51_17165 [Terriglobia bacterium]|nr:MAG: hypothetical protein C5B51_17165 [Terriglobia bacterium]